MIQIFPEETENIFFYDRNKFVELTPDEVKNLPLEIIINVATINGNTGYITVIQEYVTGMRFNRPVLYKLPLRDSFINIGHFSNRKYLYRCK